MRGDSLLRIIIEGRMEGKNLRGRPRMMLLDWMMEEDYSKLRRKPDNVTNGNIGRTNLPSKAENQKKKNDSMQEIQTDLL